MRHSFIKWGGRAARYKETKGAVRRLIDPVTDTPIALGTDLQLENWLLHRFDPRVTRLRLPYKQRLNSPDDPTLTVAVHLDLDWQDGTRELQVVGQDAAVSARLRRLGNAMNAKVTARTSSDIRQNMTLITNLRHLRRQMQQNLDVPPETVHAIDDRIVAALRRGPIGLEAMYSITSEWPQGLIDARLGQLHVKGAVVINFEGGLYGASTSVRTA